MFSFATLWIYVTLLAATAQTARNTMQRHLTASLGTVGATQVRFLYGLPFAAVFLATLVALTGETVPPPSSTFLQFVGVAATMQIAGTALMLASMQMTSFAVTIAYTKTEPVQVAVFGLIVLGEAVSPLSGLGIVVATFGVILITRVEGAGMFAFLRARPALLGLASAASYAISAVAFRGAILALPDAGFVMQATTTLVWGLALQSVMLIVYLGIVQPATLAASFRAWRQSLFAGFMGALASQLWFIGFALTTTANVRTLGLVEVVLAQIVSRRVISETISPRQLLGMTMVLAGVAALLLGI